MRWSASGVLRASSRMRSAVSLPMRMPMRRIGLDSALSLALGWVSSAAVRAVSSR
jgi:hypothetical protein